MGSSPYKNSPKYLFYRPFTETEVARLRFFLLAGSRSRTFTFGSPTARKYSRKSSFRGTFARFSPYFLRALHEKQLLTVFPSLTPEVHQKKKSQALERHSKGQFWEIRHISKEVCRILRLWIQMQCLSGKLTIHK